MSKIKFLALLAVLTALLFPAMALAQPMVCGFYGSVAVDGKTVADGTVVTAWIDGVQVASNATVGSNYSVKIDGQYTAKPVTFKWVPYRQLSHRCGRPVLIF